MSAEKLYLVRFKRDDTTGNSDNQPVRASRAEVDAGCLIFTHVDGTLSAFFDMSVVDDWHEISEEELPK